MPPLPELKEGELVLFVHENRGLCPLLVINTLDESQAITQIKLPSFNSSVYAKREVTLMPPSPLGTLCSPNISGSSERAKPDEPSQFTFDANEAVVGRQEIIKRLMHLPGYEPYAAFFAVSEDPSAKHSR
jgi:hypothetical protein